MSPSPASPTEGDNLCEVDVTSMAIHSVTLLISLCGLAGNGAVISLLRLEDCNSVFFALAVIDFLYLLFAVPSALLFLVEDISCSPILSLLYLNYLFQLSVMSFYWAMWQAMAGSAVQYMDKVSRLCCRCGLPLRLFWVVLTVQYWAFFALFTVIPTVTLLCPAHEQEHCRAAFISMYTLVLLLFVAPAVISCTVIFIKAKWGSQQQQPKRRDIVIVLVVLFTFILSLCHFLQQLGYFTVSSEVVFLLSCISSSIKPFIYFLVGSWKTDCSMGSCWRHCSMESCRKHSSTQSLRKAIHRVFEEPEENTASGNDPSVDTGV